MEDLIKSLGHMALGTRLKRIGDILQTQTQVILDARCAEAPPASHHAILMALRRNGDLSIGELAQTLVQSQPGVTRMVNKLIAQDLVTKKQDEKDQRISRISFTPKGMALAEKLAEGGWQEVDAAVADACAGLAGPFLAQLEALEQALLERPLPQRTPNSATQPPDKTE